MADHRVYSTGLSQVPLGGRGVYKFTVRESGNPEDATSIRFIVKNPAGTSVYDASRTSTDIDTTASDGGRIEINDITGTGAYEVAYTPPNNGTYSPTSDGLAFSFQVIATDEDGTADTGEFTVTVVGSEITISDRSSVIEKVRMRTGIVKEIHHGPRAYASGATEIDLGTGAIYEIVAAFRNGAAMTQGTDYTWSTYGSYMTLTSAHTGSDEFFFRVQTLMSNDLMFDMIDEAEDMVVYPKLIPFYTAAELAASPTVQALICAHVVGRIRQDITKGETLKDPVYRSGWELINEVKAILDSIARGEQGILDADGDEIAKKSGAMVGSFIHPDGGITGRLKMVDRAQRWQGILNHYYPETDPEDVLDVRKLD